MCTDSLMRSKIGMASYFSITVSGEILLVTHLFHGCHVILKTLKYMAAEQSLMHFVIPITLSCLSERFYSKINLEV